MKEAIKNKMIEITNFKAFNQTILKMDIDTALELLFASESFKRRSKDEAKLRVYKKRFKDKSLGEGAAFYLLKEFGFTYSFKKPKKFK